MRGRNSGRTTVAGWMVLGFCAGSLGVATAQEDLADVIERSERAVVRIEVEGHEGGGIGSGFIVDPAGILVTNVHVLAGAKRAVATFPDGRSLEISGTLSIDEGRDICVAQLSGDGLHTLPIAVALPRKGERVTALGSPHGLSFTATTGIISAIRPAEELGRDIGDDSVRGTWIQVDAALSPGNSGGPLIDSRGQVVAMSTRASQGSAQNLNFGISAVDIRGAVDRARSGNILGLSEGVGKIRMEEAPESGGLIERPPVSRDRLQKYIAEGRESFRDLAKGLNREHARASELYREMRRGEIHLPPGAPESADVARLVGDRTTRYFFRSQTVKDRSVDRQQERVRSLDRVRASLTDATDDNAVFSLLWNYGPRLDPRRAGSIGFLSGASVLHAFTDHDVIIEFEGNPYLIWVESTAGLSEGQEVMPVPVLVAGTTTLDVPGQAPRSMTVLHAVTEAELRKAVFGKDGGNWRVWKDSTGKYEVEAVLVETTETEVRLRKRDGSVTSVPLSRLCDDDLKFLGKNR